MKLVHRQQNKTFRMRRKIRTLLDLRLFYSFEKLLLYKGKRRLNGLVLGPDKRT